MAFGPNVAQIFGQIQRIFPISARANPLGHLDDMTVEVPPVAGQMLELDIAWFMAQRSRLAVIIDFALQQYMNKIYHDQVLSYIALWKIPFLWVAAQGLKWFNRVFQTRFASTPKLRTLISNVQHILSQDDHIAMQVSAEYRAPAVLNFVNARSPIKRGWPQLLWHFQIICWCLFDFASGINLISPWGSNKTQSPCSETS